MSNERKGFRVPYLLQLVVVGAALLLGVNFLFTGPMSRIHQVEQERAREHELAMAKAQAGVVHASGAAQAADGAQLQGPERVIAFTDWTTDLRSSDETIAFVTGSAQKWLAETSGIAVIDRKVNSVLSQGQAGGTTIRQYFVYTITIFYREV